MAAVVAPAPGYAPLVGLDPAAVPMVNAPGVAATPAVAGAALVAKERHASVWSGWWGLGAFIVWLLVLAAVFSLIIWAVQPLWAVTGVTATGKKKFDAWKIIGAGFGFALIITILIFVIAALVAGAKANRLAVVRPVVV